VFATNHYLLEETRDTQLFQEVEDLHRSSVSRYTRLSERLTGRSLAPHPDLAEDAPDYAYGRVDPQVAIDLLRDPVDMRPEAERRNFPCDAYPTAKWAVGTNAAMQSIVMLPDQGRFWLAAGWDTECQNPAYNTFVGFDARALMDGEYVPGSVPAYDPPYNASYGSAMHDAETMNELAAITRALEGASE